MSKKNGFDRTKYLTVFNLNYVSNRFEGTENKTITCSTKVCSFGTQVVEKVEVSTMDIQI